MRSGTAGRGATQRLHQLGPATLVALLGLALGCTSGRKILELSVDLPPDPEGEIVFRLPIVEDARHFERFPPAPSMPSLRNPDDVDDPSVTQRAIARQRSAQAKVSGDIVLPEGETVAGLVAAAIVRGVRDAGHRVVHPDDPAFAAAKPITARIDRFWAWQSVGPATFICRFEVRVHIVAPVGSFADGEEIGAEARRAVPILFPIVIFDPRWRETLEEGLASFSDEIAAALAAEATRPTPEEDPV